jgi:hypothetical protein
MDKIDFLLKDNLCEDALIELGVISNKLDWIQKYNDLYNEISIKLEGLPSIAIKIIKE